MAQFVHTSVTGAGQHRDAPGWEEGRWTSMENYFDAKTAIQDRVREADFVHWTLLKPGVFMENFLPGSFMFPRGVRGELVTCVKPDTELALVTVNDVGVAAAAAFADPARFDGVESELAGERLSMTQIAQVLSRALGVELTAPDMTPEEAVAAGASPFAARAASQAGCRTSGATALRGGRRPSGRAGLPWPVQRRILVRRLGAGETRWWPGWLPRRDPTAPCGGVVGWEARRVPLADWASRLLH